MTLLTSPDCACECVLLAPVGALFTGAPVFCMVSMALTGKPEVTSVKKKEKKGCAGWVIQTKVEKVLSGPAPDPPSGVCKSQDRLKGDQWVNVKRLSLWLTVV